MIIIYAILLFPMGICIKIFVLKDIIFTLIEIIKKAEK